MLINWLIETLEQATKMINWYYRHRLIEMGKAFNSKTGFGYFKNFGFVIVLQRDSHIVIPDQTLSLLFME